MRASPDCSKFVWISRSGIASGMIADLAWRNRQVPDAVPLRALTLPVLDRRIPGASLGHLRQVAAVGLACATYPPCALFDGSPGVEVLERLVAGLRCLNAEVPRPTGSEVTP